MTRKLIDDDTFQMSNTALKDIQFFRTWLLDKNAAGYSQSYASLVFGMLKEILEFAVTLNYLDKNVTQQVKPIPKVKTDVPYWTKEEIEKVISKIYTEDFYEHLCFVMLWVYYMTGVRVNEGTALWWNDVDLGKKQLRVQELHSEEPHENS